MYKSKLCCRSNSLHVRARRRDDSSAKRNRILTGENQAGRFNFKRKQSLLGSEIEKTPQSHETSTGKELLQDDASSIESIQSTPVGAYQGRKVSPEQTPKAVASLVRRTQCAITSEDNHLREHLADIYRELGINCAQVQRLAEALDVHERKSRKKVTTKAAWNIKRSQFRPSVVGAWPAPRLLQHEVLLPSSTFFPRTLSLSSYRTLTFRQPTQ